MSRRLCCCLSLLVAAPACAGSRPSGPAPDAGTLFASLVRTATATQVLQAEGRVTYWGDEGRVRLRTVLVAQRPASFRVETLTPFQEPLDIVACDGASLWWLGREDFRVGPASPDNLGQVLPLPLEPPTVVDVLMGGIPTDRRWLAESVEAGPDDTWRLKISDPRGGQAVLGVDRDHPRVRFVELPAQRGQPAVFLQLEDHAGTLARRIEVKIPAVDRVVQIRLDEPSVDGRLAPGLFGLQAPPGRSPQPW